MKDHYDVVIIGAGAAGMMCAIEAGTRYRTVLLIDHSPKIGTVSYTHLTLPTKA